MKTNTITQSPSPSVEAPAVDSTPLPSPRKLRAAIPPSPVAKATVSNGRATIARILEADDPRLLVVCGPCSIHDINASIEYAKRLSHLARRVESRIAIAMRTYFEKPRSIVGWKGLVYDPELNGSSDPTLGLGIARRLLAKVNEMGLPCATEFLNPVVAPYLEDLIAYGAIGARTAESQIHRELASRLPMPVGIKNDMEGNIGCALNAVRSANQAHSFFGTDDDGGNAILNAPGNPYAHVFLRGGRSGPNLDQASIETACDGLASPHLKRPVMLDCSHANSGKDHRRQGSNALEATRLFQEGHNAIAGIMLESNLVEGNQPIETGVNRTYGQSVTDSCIGWDETESAILKIHDLLNSKIDT